MLVVPFLRSMRHQCLSCNGSVFAVTDWNAEQNFIDLASTWPPGQDLTNPDQWSAPILLALKQTSNEMHPLMIKKKISYETRAAQARFFYETKCAAGKTYQVKCEALCAALAGQIF